MKFQFLETGRTRCANLQHQDKKQQQQHQQSKSKGANESMCLLSDTVTPARKQPSDGTEE